MNASASIRNFVFKCLHGFRGYPVTYGGVSFRIDESLRRWDLGGEAGALATLRKHIRSGDLVLDIGANFGMHTLLMAHLVGKEGEVFAFEPVPEHLRLLRRNLRLSHVIDQVVIEDAAVSNSGEDHLEFFIPVDGFTNTASLVADSTSAKPLRVRNLRLDDYDLPHDANPTLIKIDVEGAEHEVLKGAENLLRRASPVLLIEIHGFALPDFGTSVAEVRSFLEALGYREEPIESEDARGEELFQSLFVPAS